MTVKKIWKTFLICAAGAVCLVSSACDSEHNVNAGNLVTVSGQVFMSRLNRAGAPDVTVVIEKAEDSSTPSIIPDIIVRTDANGRYEARFSLSYPDGGGVFDITPVFVEQSMRILMVSSENRIFDLGAGFTFQVGKKYNIWDVFLEDFSSPADSSKAPAL